VIAASADLLTGLPLAHACAVLELGRGGYYRASRRVATANATAPITAEALLAAIEATVLEFPGYGYPRVTAHLKREGWEVNHKRVYRLMREAGLLQVRQRGQVRTTDSEHGLPIFPNLLSECGWRQLTAPDQAWGADLTYVRLGDGFCYLAVVLDLFSRRIVGWNLAESLEAQGALSALELALTTRQPLGGWIHHSDRGVQYACREYVQRLKQAGARISMTAVGEPKENAQAERVIRTLKEEEVDLQEYGSFAEAARGIGRFIETVYNRKRLHSALGYRPPSEFEELFAAGVLH
jgi:transposase InsO family protein